MISETNKFPKSEIPITGKYAVIQVQRFSGSGSIDLPIDNQFVSFFPDMIILQQNEKGNDIVHEVVEVLLNETEPTARKSSFVFERKNY